MKTIKEKALIIQPKAADAARQIPQGIWRAAALGHSQTDQSEQDREWGKPEDQVADGVQQSVFHVTDMFANKFKRSQAKSKNPFQTNRMRSSRISNAEKSSVPLIRPRQNAFHSCTVSTQMKNTHLLRSQKFTLPSMAKAAKSISQKIMVSIKSFATSLKSIGTVIAAGGWTAVALIITLAIIGWIITTPVGIFAGGRYEDDLDRSVYSVLDELVKEVDDKINEIIRDHGESYDISIHYVDGNENILEQVGPLVLAVYAVKVSTDPSEQDQIVTLDERKEAILRDIFWQAVLIDFEIHNDSVMVNNDLETSNKYLTVRIKMLSMDQLVNVLNLTDEQRAVVCGLLEFMKL